MQPGRREILERGQRNVDRSKRLNAKVCIGVGALFALFALACFGTALMALVAGGVASAVGVGVFGLFWTALTALLLWLGVSGLRKVARDERLRSSGVRARGIVLGYSESSFRVDGATQWQLSLRIEMEGRPPWDATTSVAVVGGQGARIYEGATLAVLVNASDPREVLVDLLADP
jgi:hypothetical protein